MGMHIVGQAQESKLRLKTKEVLEGCLPIALVQSFKRQRRSAWNVDIDSCFSASLVGLRIASANLSPAQKVRFVRYAQFRTRWAVLDFTCESDWDLSQSWHDGPLVEEAIQTLSSLLKSAPFQGELASELKISLDIHRKRMRYLNCLAISGPYVKGERGSLKQRAACISDRLVDERPFWSLQVETVEQIPDGLGTRPHEAARCGESVVQTSGTVQARGPNLRRKSKSYLERCLIAMRFTKRLRDWHIYWNADADKRFSAALAGLVEASANLEPAQKLQFVSYAQFCIQREILKGLRD